MVKKYVFNKIINLQRNKVSELEQRFLQRNKVSGLEQSFLQRNKVSGLEQSFLQRNKVSELEQRFLQRLILKKLKNLLNNINITLNKIKMYSVIEAGSIIYGSVPVGAYINDSALWNRIRIIPFIVEYETYT